MGLRKRGGRNAYGRITVRHRGGGADQKYRMIDFKRTERDVSGKLLLLNMIQIVMCVLGLYFMLMVQKLIFLCLKD